MTAVSATSSSPPECDATTLSALTANASVAQCMAKSGISILTLPEQPTLSELSVFCKTSACHEVVQLFVDLDPAECTLPSGNHLLLRGDIIDRTVQQCAQVGVPLKLNTPLPQANRRTSAAAEGVSHKTIRTTMIVPGLVSLSLLIV